MRTLLAAMLLGGCGRIAFDSAIDADPSAPPAPVVVNGLVLYMPFDDDPTDGVEANGSANPIAHCGVTCPTFGDGRFGGAYKFDGVNNGVIVDDSAALHLTTGTAAVWMKVLPTPPDGDSFQVFGAPFQSGDENTWEISLIRQDGRTEIRAGGDSDGIGVYHVENYPTGGRWEHVALTWDDGESLLYVDGGILHTANPINMTYDAHGVYVGIDDEGGQPAHPLPGLLDELRLYDRVLDEGELRMLAGR